jgi:uncharacterized coiled-coil protein SlyX
MNLISIADAAKLLGRHEKTVRRWIKKQQAADPQSGKRIVQEAIASGFSYRVDRGYLLAHFPAQADGPPGQDSVRPPGEDTEQHTRQPTHPADPLAAAKDETIAILKEQVRQQQEELKRKNEQLNTMLERLREQNILLKGYQEKYLLEAPREEREVDSQLDTKSEQPTGQYTVHSHEPNGQAKPSSMDKNHKRKESTGKNREEKSTNKLHDRRAHKTEQAKRKGFFSFLRRK